MKNSILQTTTLYMICFLLLCCKQENNESDKYCIKNIFEHCRYFSLCLMLRQVQTVKKTLRTLSKLYE